MKTLMENRSHFSTVLLFVMLLFVSLARPVQAQVPTGAELQTYLPEASPWTFGVRAGLNMADYYGGSVSNADAEAGFSGGAFMSYRFGNHFAIQPEVLFTTRSSNLDHSQLFPHTGRVDYRFGYLDVPVLFKAYLPAESVTWPDLYVGPAVGFRVFEKAKEAKQRVPSLDLDGKFRETDWGVVLGMGYETVGDYRLVFDARYRIGLNDLLTEDVGGDFHSRAFTISVGIGF